MKRTRCLSVDAVLWLVLSILIVPVAMGSVPGQMSYQGYLRDGNGQPVTGAKNFQFYIYSDSVGGSSCWGPETHSGVPVVEGLFEVILGSQTPIVAACFDGSVKWLETWVEGSPLTPRKAIASVAYAMAGGTAGFGMWEEKSADVVYQAETDGFVVGWVLWNTGYGQGVISTDSSNPPATARQCASVRNSGDRGNLMCPVRKGDYWKVWTTEGAQMEHLYWLPAQ